MKQTLLTFFIAVILLSPSVFAEAGIGLPSDEQRTIVFEPGAVHEWTYRAYGNDYLAIDIGGDLAEYAEVDDPDPEGGPRVFTFKVTLPDYLAPGEYQVWARVMESSPTGTSMGGRAAVKGRVIVRSLYDGPFVTADLAVENTGFGLDTMGHLDLSSWSTIPISGVYADVNVYDGDEQVLTTRTVRADLEPAGKASLDFIMRTSSLEQGDYRAEAIVYYAANTTTDTTKFKIGTLDLDLISYTEELTLGETNIFSLTAQSNWVNAVPDVYGVVSLLGITEKTPTVDVPKLGKRSMKTALEVSDTVTLGLQEGTITLFYADKEKEFPIVVNVVSEPTGATIVKEQEPGSSSSKSLIIFMYIALIVLILINVFFLFWKGRKSKENKQDH